MTPIDKGDERRRLQRRAAKRIRQFLERHCDAGDDEWIHCNRRTFMPPLEMYRRNEQRLMPLDSDLKDRGVIVNDFLDVGTLVVTEAGLFDIDITQELARRNDAASN